jgi:hypothetical protein
VRFLLSPLSVRSSDQDRENSGNGIFAVDGDIWHQQRKVRLLLYPPRLLILLSELPLSTSRSRARSSPRPSSAQPSPPVSTATLPSSPPFLSSTLTAKPVRSRPSLPRRTLPTHPVVPQISTLATSSSATPFPPSPTSPSRPTSELSRRLGERRRRQSRSLPLSTRRRS